MPAQTAARVAALMNIATRLRIDSVRSTTAAGSGHPTTCCSAAEIMAVLQRHVSRRKLLEMMLLGQRLDAEEAARCGLLNRAVEPDALDAAVDEVTSTIAGKSPIAVRLGLEAFAAQDDLDLESALPLLRERLAGCLATDDAREGLMAFLEKRQPRWSGK